MKKNLSVGLFVVSIFLCICGVDAQSGYKDYTWGMSFTEIRTKCPDLQLYPSYLFAPKYAFIYLYYNEIDIPPPEPLKQETGAILAYELPINNLKFWFVNKSLVAIELWYSNVDILNELEKQYGDLMPISDPYDVFFTYKQKFAVWTADDAIIVWNSLANAAQVVTYLDPVWFNRLMDKTIYIYRLTKMNIKSGHY